MGWDRVGEWISTLIVASLTLTAGLGAIEPAIGVKASPAPANSNGRGLMMGWAQTGDQPPIEQVGEGTRADPEALDEGAPPAQTAGDVETLDSATTDAQGEDIETLDQGAPPAAAPVAAAPAPAASSTAAPLAAPVPVATAAETEVAAGPFLPPGFGSGEVHVSAGARGFPVGLDDCHVGVVTGRAYVGLDCDDAESVVGHARSYEDFPFIPEVDFPFEGDEEFFINRDFPFDADDEPTFDDGFFASGREQRADDTRLVISAGNGSSGATDDEIAERGAAVSGSGSIELAQRTRVRDPRVRVSDRNSKRSKNTSNSSKNSGNSKKSNVSSASNDDSGSDASATKDKKDRKGKSRSESRAKGEKKDKAKATSERKQKAKDGKKRDKHDKRDKREKRDRKRASGKD